MQFELQLTKISAVGRISLKAPPSAVGGLICFLKSPWTAFHGAAVM